MRCIWYNNKYLASTTLYAKWSLMEKSNSINYLAGKRETEEICTPVFHSGRIFLVNLHVTFERLLKKWTTFFFLLHSTSSYKKKMNEWIFQIRENLSMDSIKYVSYNVCFFVSKKMQELLLSISLLQLFIFSYFRELKFVKIYV